MLPLKLKVYIDDDGRKIENFSEDQWKEVTVIFEKLVRNLKQEIPEVIIEDFKNDEIPYITMRVNFQEDYDLEEEKLEYIASYLSGEETDNPVYFEGEEKPQMAGSSIILEEKNTESLLERFNRMVVDLENSNDN